MIESKSKISTDLHSIDCIRKSFTMADQISFAELSGDYNPMHMSPLAARRTLAGACVVHGLQAMLWALDTIAPFASLDCVSTLDADFAQFIYLDEGVSVHIIELTTTALKIELRVNTTRVAQYGLKFGSRIPHLLSQECCTTPIFPQTLKEARNLSWNEIQAERGRITYNTSSSIAYPNLAKSFGDNRLAGILALTRLVGMICPGLYSTFHRINVKFTEDKAVIGALDFSVAASEQRFSIVTMAVKADGIAGTVKASRRRPPVLQPDCAALNHLVAPDKFKGHKALIIGGSRGIGEVTAKILALGGAETVITYANGEADAKLIADDIKQSGGKVDIVRFDVLSTMPASLKMPQSDFSSVYYFATPRITMRASGIYSPDLFQKFFDIYVDKFNNICLELAKGRNDKLQIFYPSTVFINKASKNMAEYAMAKAAGEVLAADITQFQRNLNVVVERLPRMPTDQTASMIEHTMLDPASVMLPIIQRIEAEVSARVEPDVNSHPDIPREDRHDL